MKRYHIDIGGMTCAHCAKTVTGALEGVEGVTACTVDLSSNCASVEIDESQISVAKAVDAVKSAGFTVGGFHLLDSAQPSQG